MHSPVHGRITSRYGRRWGRFHAGLDLATGRERRPVFAAFAGTVERVVRGRAHGDRSTANMLAPGRTGNGVIVRNPDGEAQLYGHVDPCVNVGDRVAAGQRLGVVDLSGNTTGLHLHLETWNAAGRTRDPRGYFRFHRLTPGAPPTPPPPPPPAPSPGDPRVADYQTRQNRHGAAGLVVDGIDGPRTAEWRAWAAQAQRAVNAWRSRLVDLDVDGDYGPRTAARVRDLESRNRLAVDGVLEESDVAFMRRHGSTLPHRP